MLERFSIVVFSAKNDGGADFREKYDLGAIQGSKIPQKWLFWGQTENNEFPNTQECATVAQYKWVY